ncbi:MAG TPA: hypothetical protein DCP92_18470 [Nitrospiraceae bacterium]|jgi:hypothetical protein|nr:hypothetical protein [Nitrospiraceae bacterium]
MTKFLSSGQGGDSMVLELDAKERETLKRALEVLEEKLRNERVKTGKREWRASLRDEEDSIKRILKKVA